MTPDPNPFPHLEVLMPESLPPWIVGALRGAIEAAVLVVIGALIVALGDAELPAEWAPFAPVAVMALRTLEGVADQRIDPTRQRALGGRPAQD